MWNWAYKGRWLWFSCGYDPCYEVDASIYVGLLPFGEPPSLVRRQKFRFWLDWHWNWRPVVVRWTALRPVPFGVVDSWRWTGRSHTVEGVYWAHSFRCGIDDEP